MSGQYHGPGRYVVRGLGSGAHHLADLTDELVDEYASFGALFDGVDRAALRTLCRVKPLGGVAVIMEPKAKPTCSSCKRLNQEFPRVEGVT